MTLSILDECQSRESVPSGDHFFRPSHGCPIGLADMTPSGRHGVLRCFLEATHVISPRLHFCGHLHIAQERTLKDGRKVINVGMTPEGSYAVTHFESSGHSLEARLEMLTARP